MKTFHYVIKDEANSLYYAGIAVHVYGTKMVGNVRLSRKENAYEKNA